MTSEPDRAPPRSLEPWPDGAGQSAAEIADVLVEALDWLDQGVVLARSDGRVLFASASARELLSSERGLTISGGLLQARSPSEAATLRHLIARCVSSSAGDRRDAPPLLSCRVGEPSLVCLVSRVLRTEPIDRRSDAAIVFIVDPTRVAPPSVGHVQHHFGLTAAEAVVAVDVVSGDGLKASVERLGVSLETGRTHLRRIFAKTGARRQAELVRLLLSARHTVRAPQTPHTPQTPKTWANGTRRERTDERDDGGSGL